MEKNIFIECLFEAFRENDLESAICAESAEKLYQFSLILKEENEKFTDKLQFTLEKRRNSYRS